MRPTYRSISRLRAAFHEAGHCVVHFSLENPHEPVVSIRPEGVFGGLYQHCIIPGRFPSLVLCRVAHGRASD